MSKALVLYSEIEAGPLYLLSFIIAEGRGRFLAGRCSTSIEGVFELNIRNALSNKESPNPLQHGAGGLYQNFYHFWYSI